MRVPCCPINICKSWFLVKLDVFCTIIPHDKFVIPVIWPIPIELPAPATVKVYGPVFGTFQYCIPVLTLKFVYVDEVGINTDSIIVRSLSLNEDANTYTSYNCPFNVWSAVVFPNTSFPGCPFHPERFFKLVCIPLIKK